MATKYHIGAKELRGDLAAYAKRFNLLEVKVPKASDLALGPSAATLRKWRRNVPPTFEFVVVAGPSVGALKPGAAFDAELEATLEYAKTLLARCVVVRTPREVTPTTLSKQRLVALVERLPRDASHVAWDPQGVWEIEVSSRFAKRHDLVLVVDPSKDPMPEGAVGYARLRALGQSRSFGQAALERIAGVIGDRKEAYVVIESDSALTECKKLRQIAAARRTPKKGAFGRVVRPVQKLKVLDDEQE